MSVHVREIYPGKWYLRITYQNIRKTKACSSKESATRLKKKLDTAQELYGLDALRVIEEAKEREQTVRRSRGMIVQEYDRSRAVRQNSFVQTRRWGGKPVSTELFRDALILLHGTFHFDHPSVRLDR